MKKPPLQEQVDRLHEALWGLAHSVEAQRVLLQAVLQHCPLSPETDRQILEYLEQHRPSGPDFAESDAARWFQSWVRIFEIASSMESSPHVSAEGAVRAVLTGGKASKKGQPTPHKEPPEEPR